jgi:hypothetical protein
MGLRVRRKVTGPMGDWELYVTKLVVPDWKGPNEGVEPEFASVHYGESERANAEIRIANAERRSLNDRSLNYLGALLGSAKDAATSSAVQVEAVNWAPPTERLIWTTTDQAVESVLDEIAEGLKAGKVVQPAAAVYSGAKQQ